MSKHKTHQPGETSSNNYASRLLSRMLDDRKRPGQDNRSVAAVSDDSAKRVATPAGEERKTLVEIK